jgi:hypothetical protein
MVCMIHVKVKVLHMNMQAASKAYHCNHDNELSETSYIRDLLTPALLCELKLESRTKSLHVVVVKPKFCTHHHSPIFFHVHNQTGISYAHKCTDMDG